VAVVLAEPAMTNVELSADAGYWKAARELTRNRRVLDADETQHDLRGARWVYAGVEASQTCGILKTHWYGFRDRRTGDGRSGRADFLPRIELEDCDVGEWGTLAGNALSLAAMRSTLENVLTAKAFESIFPWRRDGRMVSAAKSKTIGCRGMLQRLGHGREYTFRENPPRNAGIGSAADFELERFLHLYALIAAYCFHAFSQYGADVPCDDCCGRGSATPASLGRDWRTRRLAPCGFDAEILRPPPRSSE